MGTKPDGAIEADDGGLRIEGVTAGGNYVVFQVPLISRPANKKSFNIRFQMWRNANSDLKVSNGTESITYHQTNSSANWDNTHTLHTDQSKDTIDDTGLVEDYGSLNKEDLCSQEQVFHFKWWGSTSAINKPHLLTAWISGEKDNSLTPNQQYTYVHTYHVTDRRPASSYLMKKGLAENLNTLIQENKICMSFPL